MTSTRSLVSLALFLITGCDRGSAAPTDAPHAGVVGGAGATPTKPARSEPRVDPSSKPAKPPEAGCSKSGTATIESNAGIDATCVTVLGSHLVFVVGREGGPKFAVQVLHRKDGKVGARPVAGQQYVAEGTLLGALFDKKKKAERLARPIYTTTLTGVPLPERAILGLGKGTITWRKLPEPGERSPFEAEFDMTFVQFRLEVEGAKATRVSTGPDFHVKGVVIGN